MRRVSFPPVQLVFVLIVYAVVCRMRPIVLPDQPVLVVQTVDFRAPVMLVALNLLDVGRSSGLLNLEAVVFRKLLLVVTAAACSP
jgi:hypothetical protein